MWLFIESVQSNFFRLGLLSGERSRLWRINRRSNYLLLSLSQHISRSRLKQIEGVCVVEGPGAFTPIRTGVLVANLLARIFKKPLIGISADLARDLPKLAESLMAKSYCPVEYVAPRYSSEPNITIKKISP